MAGSVIEGNNVYKIIFQVNDGKGTVIYNKEFEGLAAVFQWADNFVAKHDWTDEYKIVNIKQRRRNGKNS